MTFDLWIGRLVRLVGIAGLLYELIGDHVANPTALVVFGGLATGPDILSYWKRMNSPAPSEPPVRSETIKRDEP